MLVSIGESFGVNAHQNESSGHRFVFSVLTLCLCVMSSPAAGQPLPEDQPDGQQQQTRPQEDSGFRLCSKAFEEIAV